MAGGRPSEYSIALGKRICDKIGRGWTVKAACEIAVEIEGGVYSGGRHTRGNGFEQDAIKYNRAVASGGWRVLRFIGLVVVAVHGILMLGVTAQARLCYDIATICGRGTAYGDYWILDAGLRRRAL